MGYLGNRTYGWRFYFGLKDAKRIPCFCGCVLECVYLSLFDNKSYKENARCLSFKEHCLWVQQHLCC